MFVWTLTGKGGSGCGRFEQVGNKLVKCTSTYFVTPFWRGVGRSFIDTIKNVFTEDWFILQDGGSANTFISVEGGRYYLLMHVAFFFAIVCEVFRGGFYYEDKTTK